MRGGWDPGGESGESEAWEETQGFRGGGGAVSMSGGSDIPTSQHPVQKFSLGPTSMRAVSALVPVSLGNKHQDDSHFTDRKVEAHGNTAVRGPHLTGAPDASRASEGDAQSPRGPYPSPLQCCPSRGL